jgi:hypothetical protein
MKTTTSKSSIKILALSLVLILVYTGCKKDVVDTDTSSATDNSKAESSFSTVFRTVNQNADSTDKRSNCPALTFVTTSTLATVYPKTLTVDYGAGCNGKSGKIVAVFSGSFYDAGSVITITYDNYDDDGYLLNADSHRITNTGTNGSGNYVYTVEIKNATLTSGTDQASWTSTKSIEWIQGRNTKHDASDDVFLITGSSSGISSKKVSYKSVINTPLKIATACDWIESGVLTLTPDGKVERTIDFGNTGCDNKATVKIAGKTFDIKM